MKTISGLVAALLVSSLLANPGHSEAACATASLINIVQMCPLNAEAIKSAAVTAECCKALTIANTEGCYCDPKIMASAAQLNIGQEDIVNISRLCNVESAAVAGSPLCNTTADAPSSSAPTTSTNATGCESANYIAPIAAKCPNDSFSNASAIPSADCCQALKLANDAECLCSAGVATLIKGRPNLVNNLINVCKIADLQLYGVQGCGGSTDPNVTSAPSPAPNAPSTSPHHAPHWLWATLLVSLLVTYSAM